MSTLKKIGIALLVLVLVLAIAAWWVLRDGAVVAVIDLDSPRQARFDTDDRTGLEALARLLSLRI